MDIYQIRKQNLISLLGKRPKGATAIAWEMAPAHLSQILSDRTEKNLGDDVARRIESKEGLARGWLDQIHTDDPFRDGFERRTAESGFHGRDDFPLRDGARSSAPRHTLAQRELLKSQRSERSAESEDYVVMSDDADHAQREYVAPKALREKEPYRIKVLEPTLIREDVQHLMKRVATSLDVGLTATPEAGSTESPLRRLIPRRGDTTAAAFHTSHDALFAGTKAPSNMVTLLDELLSAAETGMLTEDQVEMLIHMLRAIRMQPSAGRRNTK